MAQFEDEGDDATEVEEMEREESAAISEFSGSGGLWTWLNWTETVLSLPSKFDGNLEFVFWSIFGFLFPFGCSPIFLSLGLDSIPWAINDQVLSSPEIIPSFLKNCFEH